MIDWDRALELRDDIGADDFDEVVDLFLDEVEAALAKLPAAYGDHASYARALHYLKGAALNLGFADLARLCAKGESAANAGMPAPRPSDVQATYDASKAAFFRELPARAA